MRNPLNKLTYTELRAISHKVINSSSDEALDNSNSTIGSAWRKLFFAMEKIAEYTNEVEDQLTQYGITINDVATELQIVNAMYDDETAEEFVQAIADECNLIKIDEQL